MVNTFNVQTSAGEVIASIFWEDSEGIFSIALLEQKCHNEFRAICADIKEVKTMTLKGSVKHEDESSAHPPYSPDLEPSEFHLFRPLKDALGCCFVEDNELKHGVHKEL